MVMLLMITMMMILLDDRRRQHAHHRIARVRHVPAMDDKVDVMVVNITTITHLV
jgi:hypothetical protein